MFEFLYIFYLNQYSDHGKLVISLSRTRNWSKHQFCGFIKITTDVFPKCFIFKVELLCNGYLNQLSYHGKLPLKPNYRIVKMGFSVGFYLGPETG